MVLNAVLICLEADILRRGSQETWNIIWPSRPTKWWVAVNAPHLEHVINGVKL